MLIIIMLLLGVELYFLISWALGERESPLGGTKTTRENLPKAYLTDIAQKILYCIMAIGVAQQQGESTVDSIEELASQGDHAAAMWSNLGSQHIIGAVMVFCFINIGISYYFYT